MVAILEDAARELGVLIQVDGEYPPNNLKKKDCTG